MVDRYASHLPVLMDVVAREKPVRVLEYGGGSNSTPFFLAHVGVVFTVETDAVWRHRIERAHPQLEVCAGGYPEADDFDLIFIDDGDNAATRTATIRHVLSRPHPTVVIHDAEVYGDVIDMFSTDYIVHPTCPDTAVIEATNR